MSSLRQPMTHAANVAECRRLAAENLIKPEAADFSKPSLAIEENLAFPEQNALGHVTDRDLSAEVEMLGIAGVPAASRLLTDANAAAPQFFHKYARATAAMKATRERSADAQAR